MSRVIDVLFNDGQDESIDKIALPDGKFALLQNCRLERDGRVAPRQNHVSLTNVTNIGAALRYRAFDLTTYQDRLIAIGAQDSAIFTPVYGRSLFTYVNNAQNVWLQHLGANVSPISNVTRLWQSNTGLTAHGADIAYTNGQLCVVQADAAKTQITVNRLTTAGIVLSTETFSAAFATVIVSARVCACGNVFVLVVRQTNGDMVARRFDTTGTATSFSGSTVLEAAVTAVLAPPAWDLSPLGGTTDFLITYPRTTAGNTRVRRHVSAAGFAVVNTLDIAGGAFACAVLGDTTHTVLHALNSGTNMVIRTLSTALAVTSGPTNILGVTSGFANSVGQPALCFMSSTVGLVTGAATGTLTDLDSQQGVFAIVGHGGVSVTQNLNVMNVSKPFFTDKINNFETWSIGQIPAGGNESSTLRFFATCVHGNDFAPGCAGVWNYGIAGTADVGSTNNTAGRSTVVTDGTYWYGVCTTLSGLDVGSINAGALQVVRLRIGQPDRRQAAEMQGALYISGGFVYAFDGGLNSSELGFLDTPVIDATITPSATGALTLLATYTYIAMYEYVDANGFTHRSTPSDPFTTTLAGANNALAFTISAPHSIRRQDFGQNAGVRVVLYRNTPNDSVFYRVAESTVLNTATFAGVISVADTRSDADAQTREVLYIYSQKPTANVAAQPCRFLAAGRDRLIYGGLPDPYMVALSQLVFPGEPVENASPNAFAFLARLPEPCTGVTALGDTYVAFTAEAIYQISGAGPQRNGTGEFFAPQAMYSDGGCIDWRSIVECGQGTFFQLAADKLYLFTGQGVEWVGQPVRDTLAAYPTISGAVLCSATQRVIFACSNLADNDGVLLVYDLRRKIWSVDTIGQPVRAVAEYLGRLAYVAKDGLVYLENAVGSFSGALPSVSIRTGSFKLFPANGNGDLIKVVFSGTYVGDSTLEGFVSYDEGKTWTSMGQQACTSANLFNPVTGAALAAGDPVQVVFTPNIRQVTRFALRFDITNGTDNGGLLAHMLSLEVEAQEFATRQPARNQR